MGGLVARDVLTRPAYYAGHGEGNERYPAVDRLIMLGTPNQGSHLVRLRGVTEIGEHLFRAFTGRTQPSTAIGDGSGEAGVDLLPGSDFLRRLNDRKLPAHTRMTIVAGKWASLSGEDASSVLEKAQRFAASKNAPQWLRDWASAENQELAASMLASAIDGLGDGCVTLESARLEDVHDVVVV